MTQLVPHRQHALTPPSPPLKTHLLRLSDAATDNRYPKRLTRAMVIATSESEPEIRAALSFYRSTVAPATEESILKHLLAMEVVYGSKPLSRDQQNLKYQIYYNALMDVPAAALARAFDEYVKRPRADGKMKFFPEPSEIRAIADEEIKEARRLARGLDVIEAALNDQAPPEEPAVSHARAVEVLQSLGFKNEEELKRAHLAAEIEKREPIPFRETPPDIARAREEALERRRQSVGGFYGERVSS